MSQQAPCTSEVLVGAACTVSIGEHIVVPPISELPIERFVFFSSPIVEPRVVETAFMFGLSHTQGGESEGRFNCCRALRQFGADHRRNLPPHPWIILDFVMWPVQVAGKPGIVVTIDSAITVRHLKVAEDVRALRISRSKT